MVAAVLLEVGEEGCGLFRRAHAVRRDDVEQCALDVLAANAQLAQAMASYASSSAAVSTSTPFSAPQPNLLQLLAGRAPNVNAT